MSLKGGEIWSDTTTHNTTGYTLASNYDVLIVTSRNGNGTNNVAYSGGGTVYKSYTSHSEDVIYSCIVVIGATKGSRVYAQNSWYEAHVYGYNVS